MLFVRSCQNAVLRAEKTLPKKHISNFRIEPEDEGRIFLRNLSIHIQEYTM